MKQADFVIQRAGPVSQQFLDRNIWTFRDACDYIRNMPYGRNSNKNNLLLVFEENCGTCSTKHSLLYILTQENHFEGVELYLGLFRMNRRNMPPVTPTLDRYGLECIPEAHNYLKFGGRIIDCTAPSIKPVNFVFDMLQEEAINPSQITDYKVTWHKSRMKEWLQDHQEIKYSLEDFWKIREECVKALSAS